MLCAEAGKRLATPEIPLTMAMATELSRARKGHNFSTDEERQVVHSCSSLLVFSHLFFFLNLSLCTTAGSLLVLQHYFIFFNLNLCTAAGSLLVFLHSFFWFESQLAHNCRFVVGVFIFVFLV